MIAPATARAADPPPPVEPIWPDAPPNAAPLPPAAPPAAIAEPAADAEPPAAPQPPTAVPPPVVVAPPPTAAQQGPAEAPPAIAAAPAPPAPPVGAARVRRETHGPAVAIGTGISFGGVGLQARYDIPVLSWLTLSPFVAGGAPFGALAGPAGVTTSIGARHRLAVDLSVAPLLHSDLYLHGTRLNGRIIYGPAAGVGYEHMSDGGWLQRVTVEFAYAAWGSTIPVATPALATLGVGFGRRIW